MKKIFFISILFFIFIFFVSCITTFVVYSNKSFTVSSTEYLISNNEFYWPLPKYHEISSKFGPRISPITGKSSIHSGIDIPAPEGTNIYSASPGKVIYLGFNGANGYTVMIENNNLIFGYSHVSPNFIVSVDDIIKQGQLIANVGPKYITDVSNGTYIDSSRKIYKWINHRMPSSF